MCRCHTHPTVHSHYLRRCLLLSSNSDPIALPFPRSSHLLLITVPFVPTSSVAQIVFPCHDSRVSSQQSPLSRDELSSLSPVLPMSQWTQTSLTPSRPAPAPPGARNSPTASTPTRPSASGRLPGGSSYSTTAYASSFPVLNQTSLSASSDMSGGVIRKGAANVKEEGFRSFFVWSKRWLVLTGTELQIFKSEVSFMASRV